MNETPCGTGFGWTDGVKAAALRLKGIDIGSSVVRGRGGLAIGVTGRIPMGRQGWDGPKYQLTAITNRPSL